MTVEFLTNLSVFLRFKAYPKYLHESSFQNVKYLLTIFLSLSLSLPTFHDGLVLRLTGNYISVPGFVTALFDVPLVL